MKLVSPQTKNLTSIVGGKNCRPVPFMNIGEKKPLTNLFSKSNKAVLCAQWSSNTLGPSRVYLRHAWLVKYWEINHHINRLKKENIVLSIGAQKSFDKIQHLFIIKILSQIEIEGNFLNLMKRLTETLRLILYDDEIRNTFL